MGSGVSKRRSVSVHPRPGRNEDTRTPRGIVLTSEVVRTGILRNARTSPAPRESSLEQLTDQYNGDSQSRVQRIQFGELRSDSRSRSDTASSISLGSIRGDKLTESQIRKVKHCLQTFESGLDIEFDVDEILSSVQIVTVSARENVFVYGVESIGLYVVDSGALNVCTDKGETVVGHLLAGDFCGELSTLFDIKSTAQVVAECQSVLLFLPKDVLMGCLSGELTTDKLLDWCVVKYVWCGRVVGSLAWPDRMQMEEFGLSMDILHRERLGYVIYSPWSVHSLELMSHRPASHIHFMAMSHQRREGFWLVLFWTTLSLVAHYNLMSLNMEVRSRSVHRYSNLRIYGLCNMRLICPHQTM